MKLRNKMIQLQSCCKSKQILLIFLSAAFFLTLQESFAQNGIKIKSYVTGLTIPVDITHAGDDRLFVVEKTGRIRIIENDILNPDPFLNIVRLVNSTGNEQGLLGLTFHPDYANNGYFYVNYINKNANAQTVIARYKVSSNPNKADSLSEKILLTVDQPYANHNGGCLKFGGDGYLYIGMGDGGSGGDPQNKAQNRKSYLGKLLRVNVDDTSGFGVPMDNPFVNDTSTLPEIWSIGWRNPWRFSFDRLTHDLWVGDVGQADWEEVDFEKFGSKGGLNYGWRCYEGFHNYDLGGCASKDKYVFPVHEYFGDPAINGCSVTGGFVYRGNIHSYLYGSYIYGDYCSGKFWALKEVLPDSFQNVLLLDFNSNSIASFGEDLQGELYFAYPGQGAIYTISDTCTLDFNIQITDAICEGSKTGSAELNISADPNLEILWSTSDSGLSIVSLEPGNYSVIVKRGACTKQENFSIGYGNKDTLCITTPFITEICASDSAILIACDAKGTYQWFKDSILLPGINGKRIFVREPGLYQVQLISTDSCLSHLSNGINITVYPLPATPSIQIQGDTLIATPGYASYRWFKNDQFFASSISNIFGVNEKASYRVEVVDSNLCHSLLSDSVFFIPTLTKENMTDHHCRIYYETNSGTARLTCDLGYFQKVTQWKLYSINGKKAIEGKSHWDGKVVMGNLNAGMYILSVESASELHNFLVFKY